MFLLLQVRWPFTSRPAMWWDALTNRMYFCRWNVLLICYGLMTQCFHVYMSWPPGSLCLVAWTFLVAHDWVTVIYMTAHLLCTVTHVWLFLLKAAPHLPWLLYMTRLLTCLYVLTCSGLYALLYIFRVWAHCIFSLLYLFDYTIS